MSRSILSTFLPAALCVAALSSSATAHLQAFQYNGHLLVFGSNQTEIAYIRGNSSSLVVAGRDGTLVNGQPSVVFTGISGSVLVDLRGGNDQLEFSDSDIEGHVVLLMGLGNDIAFVARNEIAGSFLVDGGLWGASGDLVVLSAQTGNGNLIGGDVFVVGKEVTLFARTQEVMGSTLVWTGSGNDLVTLAASIFHGHVHVDTGGGVDHVALGDAADVVPNLFDGRLDVRLGSGNDRLTVRRSTVSGQARFFGESGSDTIESAAPAFGNVFQASLLFTGFESAL